MIARQTVNADLKSKVRSGPRVFRTWFLAICIPIAMILLVASPEGWGLLFVVFGMPVALVIWALNSLWAAVLALRLARQKRWIGTLLISTLPTLLTIGLVTMPTPIRIIENLGDELHFLAMRRTYLAEIAAIPPMSEPRLVEFNLGGMSWAHRSIVYDESDELNLPSDERSQAWQDRASTLFCEPDARPFLRFTGLTQHFFLASFSC